MLSHRPQAQGGPSGGPWGRVVGSLGAAGRTGEGSGLLKQESRGEAGGLKSTRKRTDRQCSHP